MAQALNKLWALDWKQGRMEEARKEFEEALQIYHELAQNHPETNQLDVARTLNNLGLLLQKTARFDEATSLFEQAVDIDHAGLGPEHPDTLNSLNNLALVHLEMGRYDKALSIFKRVLAIQEKILGPNHPDTARTLKNLALAREKTEVSERDQRTESTQKVVGESSELATVPFDLALYELSWGASSILNGPAKRAGRAGGPISTSAVLVGMAEQGRPGHDPQWIGDFLRQYISAYSSYTQAGFAGYFELKTSPVAAASPMSAASTMKPGLSWSLQRAQEIAVQTTGTGRISGRHVLAALIIEPPQPYTLGAQRELEELHIELPLLRQRLYEWVHGYGDNDAAWRAVLVGTSPEARQRAEFAADSTTGPDLLDIEQDVLALATLIAARDTSPPLSIGLFGDWGSGKTFFMGQLRRSVAQLSMEARNAQVMQRELPFYKYIVQIEFNAWHYVEGNLWASMVDHILDNLRISDEQPSTATEKLQVHWINKLGFLEKAKVEADEKQKAAGAKVVNAENEVKKAQAEQEAKTKEFQELSKKSAARDFKLSGAFDVIKQSLKPLGFEPLSDAVMDLESSLRQARSVVERGNAALTPLLHADDRKDRWRSLLIILMGAPLAAVVIGSVLMWRGATGIAQVSAFATGAAGLLPGGAQWLRKQAEWMSQQVEKVEQAQRTYDAAFAEAKADTAEKTAKTEQELALARQDYMLASNGPPSMCSHRCSDVRHVR